MPGNQASPMRIHGSPKKKRGKSRVRLLHNLKGRSRACRPSESHVNEVVTGSPKAVSTMVSESPFTSIRAAAVVATLAGSDRRAAGRLLRPGVVAILQRHGEDADVGRPLIGGDIDLAAGRRR